MNFDSDKCHCQNTAQTQEKEEACVNRINGLQMHYYQNAQAQGVCAEFCDVVPFFFFHWHSLQCSYVKLHSQIIQYIKSIPIYQSQVFENR